MAYRGSLVDEFESEDEEELIETEDTSGDVEGEEVKDD